MAKWKTPTGRWIPNPYTIVTNPFGVKNSSYQAGFHTGADLAVPGKGGLRVVWALPHDGKVFTVARSEAYGLFMIVTAKSGHEYLFAHLSTAYYEPGEVISNGNTFARTGKSGNAKGDHLHVEKSRGKVWQYGDVVAPEIYPYGVGP